MFWLRFIYVIDLAIIFDFICFQVHLRSHFIMNGVCVRWKGWLDLERLDGVGCLEYDEEAGQVNTKKIYKKTRAIWKINNIGPIILSFRK